jgi:acylphosphatase
MESNVRARLLISGRVQGVAFRWETLQAAERYGVNGWVRNLPDGRVEAVVEGPRQQVTDLIDWCRKGPPVARVDSLDIQWEDFKGEFREFKITH